jgi:acyl carrier protein
MRDGVVSVMAAVFGVDESDISDSIVMGSYDAWDSLKHMNLVVALEEEFDVVFTDEEVTELLSVPLILEILKSKRS